VQNILFLFLENSYKTRVRVNFKYIIFFIWFLWIQNNFYFK